LAWLRKAETTLGSAGLTARATSHHHAGTSIEDVHELSIVCSVVESVQEAIREKKVERVEAVNLRVGALSGVLEDALLFSYEIATQGTPLEGSVLRIERVPVRVYCAGCEQESELASVQSFRCPRCQELTADIRSGRELEIKSIEIDEVV
jgi:hydrogenase nickel incorporation protein HypA/HybF